MLLTFTRFDYESSDRAAEERNYVEHHVELARR